MTAGTLAKRLNPGFGIMAVAMLASYALAGSAFAQGSRLDSLLNGAARFLERQGGTIKRSLNQAQQGSNAASRTRKINPPLPPANPHRLAAPAAAVGEAVKKAAPASSPETADPVSDAVSGKARRREAEDRLMPARPAETAETGPGSLAAQTPMPLPDRNPGQTDTYEVAPLPEMPPPPGEIETADWTRDEIAAALAACTGALSGIVVSYEILDPIRKGRCGSPAPLRVSAIGVSPKVEIRPAATLTCRMAAGLARWLKEDVEPAAELYFGDKVVALRNIASYSCRNRYNASNRRISEHAYANALDVAAFTLASGKPVTVLDHWNEKEKKEEESGKSETNVETGDIERDAGAAARAELSPAAATSISSERAPVLDPTVESRFLHAVHDGACGIFGTTLGPEANKAHRNHLHLDMIERDHGGYCE